MNTFQDHFSGHAGEYAKFRPHYPPALFDYLASIAPSRDAALDCATGNGQAAVALAERFSRVMATDASADQIAHAEAHPKVEYHVAPAERSGLGDASVDLVTVAQALHWLDLTPFYADAKRILRPGGILAVWCYGRLEVDDAALQDLVDHYYAVTVGPYWPEGRHLVEEGYRSLDFPFEELSVPAFVMEAKMTLDALVGYLGTWSATQRYVKTKARDPLPALRDELARHWGSAHDARTIRWPLSLRAGRRVG